MIARNWLGTARSKLAESFQLNLGENDQPGVERQNSSGNCPICGTLISLTNKGGYSWFHNTSTCRLVNLALSEMGVSFEQSIRVVIYPHWGPLKGFYTTSDPYTIHIAEEAYVQFPEYIIFHETKHLVDCLTKGWSEEGTPDPFARQLCARYGFKSPPAIQLIQSLIPIWTWGTQVII